MKTFRDAIRSKAFVIAAESVLKPESNAETISIQADALRDFVDGVILTDNQHGRVHMSSLAAGRLMLDNELDPIVQFSCRNRNRIALLGDLLGAAALGISSLLLVRGEGVPEGFDPRPKAVFDLNGAELIATASTMNSDERLSRSPDFIIGGLVTPHGPKPGWVPRKLAERADAGLHYAVCHLCMDMTLMQDYMRHLVASRLTHRVAVLATTAILSSADEARWLRDNRSNAMIPDSVIERLDTASDPISEGMRICAEQLATLSETPGISGANIISPTDLAMIPTAISESGVPRS